MIKNRLLRVMAVFGVIGVVAGLLDLWFTLLLGWLGTPGNVLKVALATAWLSPILFPAEYYFAIFTGGHDPWEFRLRIALAALINGILYAVLGACIHFVWRGLRKVWTKSPHKPEG